MSDIKKQVQDWIDSGKDYDEGLNILSKNTHNKTLVRILSMNPNKSKADKILYELTKMADMKEVYKQQSEIINTPVTKTSLRVRNERSNLPKKKNPFIIKNQQEPEVIEIKHSKPFNKLPLIIQEVIKQKGGLYRDREHLHAKISDEKQLDNKPENVKKRKPILDKIDHISKRIDELYEAEISFKENGELPSDDFLNWNDEPEQEGKTQFTNFKKLPDIELKNKLTNIRSYITKDENQLKFQSKSKAEENPMPAGPKREKLENKIAVRKIEIEAIEHELKNRANQSKGNKGK